MTHFDFFIEVSDGNQKRFAYIKANEMSKFCEAHNISYNNEDDVTLVLGTQRVHIQKCKKGI